jgi:stringent starvation protein B
VSVPVAAVAGIFAKENGQGLAFQTPAGERSVPTLVAPSSGDSGGGDKPKPGGGKPRLQVVK